MKTLIETLIVAAEELNERFNKGSRRTILNKKINSRINVQIMGSFSTNFIRFYCWYSGRHRVILLTSIEKNAIMDESFKEYIRLKLSNNNLLNEYFSIFEGMPKMLSRNKIDHRAPSFLYSEIKIGRTRPMFPELMK